MSNFTKISKMGSEEESMERILYIIRDLIPKEVANGLSAIVGKVKGVKSITDMKVFIMVEFFTKIDADAAKASGFMFEIDGVPQKFDFAICGILQIYMTELAEKHKLGNGLVG